ncbi:competence protein ComEC [Mycoplasmopsis mustelae]|uniref:Competence protein ComEC n=1 Tax=Mycoplasmopsis mustelae TaxID=171289 RepID=A0A4R7UCM4_9BACT|nr:competence protein ComEC [Mycoplasmopsis mustelae]
MLLFYQIKNLLYTFWYDKEINANFQVIGIKNKIIEVRNYFNLKFSVTNLQKQDFHLYQFLNIQGILNKEKHQIIIKQTTELTNWDFRHWLFKFYSGYDGYKQTLIPMTFGYTYGESQLLSDVSEIGILHILIISGFHFNIIYAVFERIFKKHKWIATVFIWIYWFVCSWSFSVNRAFMFKTIPKKKIFAKNENRYLFIAFICLLINNQNYVGIGLFITFSLSYLLLFTKNFKTFKDRVYISFFLWFISVLFISFLSKQINLLSIFIAPLFGLIYEVILLLSLILFWFPIIGYLLSASIMNIIYLLKKFVIAINLDFIFNKEIIVVMLYKSCLGVMYYFKFREAKVLMNK